MLGGKSQKHICFLRRQELEIQLAYWVIFNIRTHWIKRGSPFLKDQYTGLFIINGSAETSSILGITSFIRSIKWDQSISCFSKSFLFFETFTSAFGIEIIQHLLMSANGTDFFGTQIFQDSTFLWQLITQILVWSGLWYYRFLLY